MSCGVGGKYVMTGKYSLVRDSHRVTSQGIRAVAAEGTVRVAIVRGYPRKGHAISLDWV